MKNVKIIPGEAISAQHRILVADKYIMMPRQTRQRNREKKIKWYDLKDENKRDELKVKLSEQTERRNQEHYQPEWHEITDTIHECAKQIMGESNGCKFVEKETWWCTEEVQTTVKKKKEAFKAWQTMQTTESLKEYRTCNSVVR